MNKTFPSAADRLAELRAEALTDLERLAKQRRSLLLAADDRALAKVDRAESACFHVIETVDLLLGGAVSSRSTGKLVANLVERLGSVEALFAKLAPAVIRAGEQQMSKQNNAPLTDAQIEAMQAAKVLKGGSK